MIFKLRSCAVVVIAAAITAGGCAKKKPEPPPAAPPVVEPTRPTTPTPPPPPPPPAPREAATAPLSEDEVFRNKSLEQLNAEKLLGDAFFGYDSVELTEEGRAVLQKNADWMKRWATTKVMVEGHGDSRGTNEYNLALAERRADAVRDYMVSLGVPTDRLTIVSKGEEQPFCSEETESCWQQNRRGHFIITAK